MNYLLTLLFTLSAISSAATPAPPQFSALKTQSSTVFECEFQFTSARTQERFSGRVKITSTGEFFLAARRNDEPVNECPMGLSILDEGFTMESQRLLISAQRIDVCTPALSEDMRARLNESIQITMSRTSFRNPPRQRSASISAVYLEGLRACKVAVMDDNGLRNLAERFRTGKLKGWKRNVATERQNISREQQRLKRQSK